MFRCDMNWNAFNCIIAHFISMPLLPAGISNGCYYRMRNVVGHLRALQIAELQLWILCIAHSSPANWNKERAQSGGRGCILSITAARCRLRLWTSWTRTAREFIDAIRAVHIAHYLHFVRAARRRKHYTSFRR